MIIFQVGVGPLRQVLESKVFLKNLCLVKQSIFRNEFKSKGFDTCFLFSKQNIAPFLFEVNKSSFEIDSKLFLFLKGKAFTKQIWFSQNLFKATLLKLEEIKIL